MSIDHIQLPESISKEARLFPLPGVVVFPHSLNPLRVFESRYREMFEDAIDGDRLIAMATLLPGHEADYYSRPPIARTVCIGQVGQYRRNSDGTYDFLLVAVQRARVEHEITPVRSYRRAAVELLPEASPVNERDVGPLARRLVAKASLAIPEFEKLVQPLEAGEITLGAITDVVAHNTKLDFSVKLGLLAECDPVARAETLIEERRHSVTTEVGSAAQSATSRQRAKQASLYPLAKPRAKWLSLLTSTRRPSGLSHQVPSVPS